MLEVTDEGAQIADQLWHQKSVKDDREMAFLAAVSAIEEYPIQDPYDLAKHIPFIHGLEAKLRAANEWVSRGWIERSGRR